MVPAYTVMALRIWIRLKRKAWGSDDWCMVAAIVCAWSLDIGVWILLMIEPYYPPFTVLTVSQLAMSYTGLGIKDADLGKERVKEGLLVL